MAEKYKKYILFDLDGTLTDPKIGICTCFQYALESFGIHEPNLDNLEKVIGPPLLDSFKEFYDFSDEDAKKGLEKYRERFSTVGLYENKVYPGIKHMLKTLKKNGFKLSVASSKPAVFVEKIMQHFGLAKYFDAMEGSNLDGTHTDKAEIINDALIKLFGSKEKIDLTQVYMVGDRKFDCIGAKKMGVESIGVAYGYGDYEELMEAHADYIVFTPKELEELLMRQTYKASQGRVARKKGDGLTLMPGKTILLLLAATLGFLSLRRALEFGFEVVLFFIIPWIADSGLIADDSIDLFLKNLQTVNIGLSYVIAAAAFIYPAIGYIKATKRDSYLLHPMSLTIWQYILGAVLALTANLGMQVAVAKIGITANAEAYQEVAAIQYSCSFAVGLIVYGIVAPLAEEMIFRGIVYGAFRRYFPISVAMLITSALFGVYHGNIVQGTYAFVFGFMMVWLYEYFGTFWAAVAVHVIANLSTYTVSYIASKNPNIVNWPAAAVMLVLAAVSLVMLFRLKKK